MNMFESEIPVFVDVWAEWCSPCKRVAPNVAALETEYEGRIKVVKINADSDSPEVAEAIEKLQVRAIPLLVIFDKGKEVWRKVGYTDLAELKAAVEKVV